VQVVHARLSLPDEIIAVCPPVIQEVLQGTSSQRLSLVSAVLYRTEMLDAPVPLDRFEYAAWLYRQCRAAGITPRSSIDCLIAAVAIAHGVTLLHNDRDFELMKRVIPLKTMTL